ncbi:hypothetical protein EKO04_008637 [Ascochyta lentis]|uniref:AAA+ ATPase domain-containing protein n=1 Tax=Ascochyta lentis TaxID=205686 RepID=A0A8H7MHG4_9PLEO|nr:hypothetical protein EKO04_008637 [Ascochyta lentis]
MNNSESTDSTPRIPPLPPPVDNKLSDTLDSSPIILPTPSVTSEPDRISQDESNMESNQDQTDTQVAETTPNNESELVIVPPPSPPTVKEESKVTDAAVAKKAKIEKKKSTKKSSKDSKRKNQESSDSENSDADSESQDSADHEKEKRKKKRKAAAKKQAAQKIKAKAKAKKRRSKKRSRKVDLIDDSSDDSSETSIDSDSDSTSDPDTDDKKAKKSKNKASKVKSKLKKRSKKVETSSDDSCSELSSSSSSFPSSNSDSDSSDVEARRKRVKAKRKAKHVEVDASGSDGEIIVPPPDGALELPVPGDDINTQVAKMDAILRALKMKQLAAATAATARITPPLPKSLARKNAHEFKRIDQVWDTKLRDYKLIEKTADQKDEFECVFTVRRRFNWEGKHSETLVDIKSKTLRGALQVVLKDCKSISLVEDIPEVDPHTLFHHYDEIKKYVKSTLKPKLKRTKKSKDQKKLRQEIAQCKLLLGYIDEDYAATRKALKPLLKAGTITYDLCWALFKPGTIAYTPTYGNKDDPRCFKVDQCFEYESWLSGAKSWIIDGRYLEYDGKVFGLGDHQAEIKAFKGHRKITSLVAYPLKYHKDPKGVRKQLIERGKKFVALQGMSYRLQKGIAYMKVKNIIAKFNINGRVMVDPAIFRRIQPNYPLSYIKQDELNREDEEQEASDDCCSSSDEDDENLSDCEKPEKDPLRVVLWKDSKGKRHPIKVFQSEVDAENGVGDNATSKLETDEDGHMARHIFTEEELLIASPVVLGFAFSEKLWLEFSLSGIEEIQWNAEAFDSLVLPDRIKSNLKGLVSSHRFNAARTIDDVIQGKGKGLNVVLHGPPGVGKTLTGESIAEYLKCPLYAVSAGELGTNSGSLERDLNRIMDITHSWGAILLLDEADVFLEARQPHDIHRNSLVSVFLRLTEYYQGILFLTTNRVETFDEAFQSRIHMGIRYENLKPPARKKIWQHHVGKVEKMSMEEFQDGKGKDRSEKMKPFKESDFDELSKRNMNGRQIKNTVKTGQSIALSEGVAFGMEHIKRVLDVAEAFEDDMRGGKGYRDAMQHYT